MNIILNLCGESPKKKGSRVVKVFLFFLQWSKIGSFLRSLSIIPIITEQACFDLAFIFESSPQINTNYSLLDGADPSFADCDPAVSGLVQYIRLESCLSKAKHTEINLHSI